MGNQMPPGLLTAEKTAHRITSASVIDARPKTRSWTCDLLDIPKSSAAKYKFFIIN